MEELPVEVLHIICSHLEFKDAANVRFVTRNLAIVAAAHLVTNVRFHTSPDSLNRLKNISNHPIFSKTVNSITYEAALLADVRCRHEYSRHFELDHHGLERPREPLPSCSSRERRLYERNKTKWNHKIYSKFEVYRSLFESQKSLLTTGTLEEVLAQCIPRFLRLTNLDLDPIRRCSHRTSERFIDEYGSDCASPLSANYSRTSSFLKFTLLPANQILATLRSLETNSLSPAFFNQYPKSTLVRAFQNLTNIDILFRLTDEDMTNGEQRQQCYERLLSNKNLRDILRAAKSLESLSIGFDAAPAIYIDMSLILKDSIWSEMKSLCLSVVKSTQDELMATLKCQPRLQKVNLALVQLTQGSWPNVVDQVRSGLSLEEFEPIGFLEDSDESWPMDLLCVPMYMESFTEFELSKAINAYVTTKRNVADVLNPLAEGFAEFEEGDVVRDMYGTPSELEELGEDFMDGSDVSMSGMSDTDASMPDLESTDMTD